MKSLNITIACLLLISTGCAHSQDLRPKLDSYVKALAEQGKFSGSVLVAKGDKILLSKGYGMANYELDVPNTPRTKFRLASITKQFTAMAIMQLQEQGLLSVDDKLIKYIPNYPHGDKITVHHLLTHSSGIPDYETYPDFKQKRVEARTLEQHIEWIKDKPLDFQPGEGYHYSNSGYILLSYIIEKVSGKTYETVITENILLPLEMNDSGYDKSSAIIKNRASGYMWAGDRLLNSNYVDMSFPVGAGALYSSVEDLYRWDQNLYSEYILSKLSLDNIFTSHVDIKNVNNADLLGYGYGFRIRNSNGRKFIHHSGAIEGFSTNILRYPADKICVIVLSNYEDTNSHHISSNLAAIVLGEPYKLPKDRVAIALDPAIYDQYVGKYRLEEDSVITIIKENNRLYAEPNVRAKIELFPESETQFFHKTVDVQISFIKDVHGKVRQLILHGSKDRVAEKIEDRKSL